jgi:riboflavin synthase
LFTGLIEETGRVVSVEEGGMTRIAVLAGRLAEDTKVGDSVSVNGVCLTVNEKDTDMLVFYGMPETLRRTALGELRKGSVVNLEQAMALGARFGGHIVQGHVDGVGEVMSIAPEADAEIWEFEAPEAVLRYAVEKGSVCVDGISLTIVYTKESSFTVSILPQTKEATNLRNLVLGDRVNLEADIIGKYVERLLGPRLAESLQIFERSVRDAV